MAHFDINTIPTGILATRSFTWKEMNDFMQGY